MKKSDVPARAKRVAKLLRERILEPHDDPPGDDGKKKPLAAKKMTPVTGGGYGPDGVMFENGKVLFCVHGHRQSITGTTEGFNVYATEASRTLANLGVISHGDADAFSEWYFAAGRREAARRDLERLRREAAECGFDLVKRSAAKKRTE